MSVSSVRAYTVRPNVKRLPCIRWTYGKLTFGLVLQRKDIDNAVAEKLCSVHSIRYSVRFFTSSVRIRVWLMINSLDYSARRLFLSILFLFPACDGIFSPPSRILILSAASFWPFQFPLISYSAAEWRSKENWSKLLEIWMAREWKLEKLLQMWIVILFLNNRKKYVKCNEKPCSWISHKKRAAQERVQI